MTHPFTIIRRVQFAETDMAGVLHFSNYYRYMEEVEHAFWRSLGDSVVLRNEGEHTVSWPRVATNCEYFAPAHFEDELELVFTVAHVGERSVTYQTEFRRGDETIASGRTTAVCCTMAGGHFRPVAIPERIRTRLQGLIASATV